MNPINFPHLPQFVSLNSRQTTSPQQEPMAPGPLLQPLFKQGVPAQHLMSNPALFNPLGKIPFQIPYPVIPLPTIKAVFPAIFSGQTLPAVVVKEPAEERASKGVKRKQEDALNTDASTAGALTKKVRSEGSTLEAPVSRLTYFRPDETLLLPDEKENLSLKLLRQRELEGQFGGVLNGMWKSIFEESITEEQRSLFSHILEDMLKRGYARSAYTLACLSSSDPAAPNQGQDNELKYYRRGAWLGSTDCCYAMGVILYKKYPEGEKNAEVAYYWRVAAALGHPKARFNYAQYLLNGKGVDANPAVALKLIEENAEILKLSNAEYALALELQSGEHIPKDLPRAYELFKRAVSKGYALAESSLARALYHGEGTAVNKAEACALYKRCADRGDSRAQYTYAQMKLRGEGVEIDMEEGIHYLHLAADQNHPSAQHTLANRYATGDGLPLDKKKAFELYKKAAEISKHGKSMFQVARMYEAGDGIERDIPKAHQYYILAFRRKEALGK
ncbi:SEL1-like repeat protein [Estrella lausannensis]|uniref:Uncharacterized protein n=1 Tax=Estrella lausannensis TaxID=483423 RepID=A0A0H5DPT6_9BACT|nr:SEL1-like repeat protein [Estrella lausannensis]CRX38581.1 hypothetical protein ELAC_1240 [Estrella lausannensis]